MDPEADLWEMVIFVARTICDAVGGVCAGRTELIENEPIAVEQLQRWVAAELPWRRKPISMASLAVVPSARYYIEMLELGALELTNDAELSEGERAFCGQFLITHSGSEVEALVKLQEALTGFRAEPSSAESCEWAGRAFKLMRWMCEKMGGTHDERGGLR